MFIHTIIFNWPRQGNSAVNLEKECLKYSDKVSVINSDNAIRREHWYNIGDDSYFGEQFRKAIEIFDGDYLFHIQADVKIKDFQELFSNLRKIPECVGIWAPDINYTTWETKYVELNEQYFPSWSAFKVTNKNLIDVINTDCSCWAIKEDVISDLKKYDLSTSHFGWGIDILSSIISRKLSLRVVRDVSIRLEHPKSTNYSLSEASKEFIEFQNHLPPLENFIFGVMREIFDERKHNRRRFINFNKT
jgi:hypothetical protein